MIGCFRFEDLNLIEPLRKHLENTLKCKVFKSYYLDYQVLYVQECFYQDAIITGCDFLDTNNAKKVCWLDTYQMPRNLNEIPLIYAEIDQSSIFEETAAELKAKIENVVNKKVIAKKHLKNSVYLHLLRNDCSLEEHKQIINLLINTIDTNSLDSIVNIRFCSFFGKKIK